MNHYFKMLDGHRKHFRRIDREKDARDAGRLTFGQVREKTWELVIARGGMRYEHVDLGTRKHGMIGAVPTRRLEPKHGRKAKHSQPLGGRGGRAHRS